MNNIKDKQNKITVREANSSDLSMKDKSKNSFKLLAEKGQKIVTAIYMITDILSKTDSMYVLIRDKSVISMKCLFENLIEEGNSDLLEEAQHNLYELLSYLSIIHRVGSLSKMNYDILFKEIGLLQKSIKREISATSRKINDNTGKISLPELFSDNVVEDTSIKVKNIEYKKEEEIEKKIEHTRNEDIEKIDNISDDDNEIKTSLDILDENEQDSIAKQDFLKDSGSFFTDDEVDLMSFSENQSFEEDDFLDDNYIIDDDIVSEDKMSFDSDFNIKDTPVSEYKTEGKDVKAERHEDILNILKGKKDASITDICFFFDDCSSKTIQRDLKELISDGRVIKDGDRRWAKYNLS